MAAIPHQRTDSSDTASSGSSAFQLILDHVLTYPTGYEIPLRTMYTLNCAPRAQPLPGKSSISSSTGSSPNLPQSAFSEKVNTQTFTESLLAQVAQLPNQPTSLPPSFITSFVQRCFPPELVLVDFPQALTGLDYLKDLEIRRRRDVRLAMERLDIDRKLLDSDLEAFSSRHPGIAQWTRSIEEKERKIESLYTQLYIGLRRWILINEMSLIPFNKHNCVAMLNTLYPPVVSSQPTSKLTPTVLKGQRDGFFNYIRSVEKHGPRVLGNLMQQGKSVGDDNGWMAVTRIIGMYLQLANSIINECASIDDATDLDPQRNENRDSKSSRSIRKADSGVSFKSFERPSTAASSTQDPPASPVESMARPKTPSSRPGTALEKLARGLKTIGRNRTNAIEMVTEDPPSPPPERAKSVRKMRSMGSIEGKSGNKVPVAALRVPSETPSFDAEQMRRQRMKWEAGILAAQKFGSYRSNEA